MVYETRTSRLLSKRGKLVSQIKSCIRESDEKDLLCVIDLAELAHRMEMKRPSTIRYFRDFARVRFSPTITIAGKKYRHSVQGPDYVIASDV